MQISTTKRTVGKFGNMARLNVWITTAQYQELRRITSICQMSITDAVGEALQVWINEQRKLGV